MLERSHERTHAIKEEDMTKKDFELIAEAIATVEGDYKGMYRELIGEIVSEIADAIEKNHPRFNRARFEAAAMPLKAEDLREAILRKLAQS
jgi:hypothetical protein